MRYHFFSSVRSSYVWSFLMPPKILCMLSWYIADKRETMKPLSSFVSVNCTCAVFVSVV
uniref:Uncharacterized protein n=1 Tax=Zea mays TaxID=4577 RepID=B4FD36_MAIZE|nr:unknown [Zea mays]